MAFATHDCKPLGGQLDPLAKKPKEDGLIFLCEEKKLPYRLIAIFKDGLLDSFHFTIRHHKDSEAGFEGQKISKELPVRQTEQVAFKTPAADLLNKSFREAKVFADPLQLAQTFFETVPRDIDKAKLNETFVERLQKAKTGKFEGGVYLWKDPDTKSEGSAMFGEESTLIQVRHTTP